MFSRLERFLERYDPKGHWRLGLFTFLFFGYLAFDYLAAVQDRRAERAVQAKYAETLVAACAVLSADLAQSPSDCARDESTYLATLTQALPAFVPKVDAMVASYRSDLEQGRLRADGASYDPVSHEFFWRATNLLTAPGGGIERMPSRVAVDVPWLMILQIGSLRIDKPAQAKNGLGDRTGVLLRLDPALGWLSNTPLSRLCTRFGDAAARCSGTVYLGSGGAVVHAVALDPLSSRQVIALLNEMYGWTAERQSLDYRIQQMTELIADRTEGFLSDAS